MRERSPGVWEVRAETGRDPITGRRRQVSRTVRGTKRDAERTLNALSAKADQGALVGTEATLKQLTDRWIAQVENDLSPTTVRGYRGLLDNRIIPALGTKQVHRIRTDELDRFYLALVNDEHLAPATVRQIHAVIRRAMRQAVRWGWISTNPAVNASPPRVPRAEITPPDVDQVMKLLAYANEVDPAFGRLLHLAATTGARRGELCAIRWRDIDAESQTLTISHSIVEIPGGLAEKDTKTHAARRIALDEGTLAVLSEQRAHVEHLAEAAEVELAADAYVFSPEPNGQRPWFPTTFTHRFEAVRKQLGLNHVRLHDLRHFAATRLIAAGVPVRTVSGRLGHANPATTLTVYAHFLEASDQAAAEVMGGLVSAKRRPAVGQAPRTGGRRAPR